MLEKGRAKATTHGKQLHVEGRGKGGREEEYSRNMHNRERNSSVRENEKVSKTYERVIKSLKDMIERCVNDRENNETKEESERDMEKDAA